MAAGLAFVVAVGVSCVPAQSQDDGPGAGPHTLAEYDAMFTELNNWGRWGEDDERGTANLVTEAKSRDAAGLVTRGVSVSLSHNPMPEEAADNPDSAFEHVMADSLRGDTITFNYHGYGVSHIDALCHFLHNGMLYNGVPASASTAAGCGKHGIQNLKNGIITRGVLLDIPRLKGVPYLEPGTAIYTEDIEAWLGQAGVTVSPGDVVFLRTGRWARRAEVGPWQLSGNSAGIHASVVRWIKARDVAFFGSDAATDVQPSLVDGGQPAGPHAPDRRPRHEHLRQHGSGGAGRDGRSGEPLGVHARGRADPGHRGHGVSAQRDRGVLSVASLAAFSPSRALMSRFSMP